MYLSTLVPNVQSADYNNLPNEIICRWDNIWLSILTLIWQGKEPGKWGWKASYLFVQLHQWHTGEAASLGPGPGGNTRHMIGMSGDVTSYRLWQVTRVLGSEPRPRRGSSLGAVHCPGWDPGPTAASWDLGNHLPWSQTSLPRHMLPVRSPRQCLDDFTTTIFLLVPSTINRGIWNSRFIE